MCVAGRARARTVMEARRGKMTAGRTERRGASAGSRGPGRAGRLAPDPSHPPNQVYCTLDPSC